MSGTSRKIQIAVALTLVVAFAVLSRSYAQDATQSPKPVNADWRPNRPTKGVKFVGSQVCAGCHKTKATSQPKTSMGLALAAPRNCTILSSHSKLTFRNGKYEYAITRDADRSLYTVTDGTSTISVPVLYCFGKGDGGQSYVLQYTDKYYESRVSFYADITGLDLTMGHVPTPPPSLEEAMGREMAMSEARSCFGCHSTNSLEGSTLRLEQLVEGVTCEACHGPGEKHVEAMRKGEFGSKQIFNPAKLNTDGVSDFCGTCHRTWEQVALMNIRGVFNVRFQPYRLANSKCYDSDDKRISCIACHDPHEPRKHDSAFYDSKCAACHAKNSSAAVAGSAPGNARAARLCPTGKANCVSCHMPQYEIPGSHLKFSDHHIRIVKPGDQYPN